MLVGVIGTAAATTTRAASSRDAYVEALVPVVAAEAAADDISLSADEAACTAAQYVDGFGLRRLRSVGSPIAVARARAKPHFDFDRFDVTERHEARIVATAFWRCLGVGRMLAIGYETRGSALSAGSRACLDSTFDQDPAAADAFIEATVRQLTGRSRVLTDGLVRASAILHGCLTAEERALLT
jgi:hypothetical protein